MRNVDGNKKVGKRVLRARHASTGRLSSGPSAVPEPSPPPAPAAGAATPWSALIKGR